MNIKKLSEHMVYVNSVQEAEFVLNQYREYVADKAIRFMLVLQKKRKDLKASRIANTWLGDKDNPGVLNQLRGKYLRYV
jgi:hypothetical protein